MKKIHFPLVFLFLFLSSINAQKTYVPDDNFEQALIDLGIDKDRVVNDSVATIDISGYENLNVHWKQISDLTGIEGFSSLRTLTCSSNQLSSLNLSLNDSLKELRCNSNNLTSLDVSKNLKLKILICDNNKLESLDVRDNTDLEILICSTGNKIGYYGNLDLRNNLKLKILRCRGILLQELDVNSNTFLEQLDCGHNYLTDLNLSTNDSLEYLYCRFNQFTDLELTSNSALKYIECDYNQLSSLDVSQNTGLTSLYCDNNQLASLNLSDNYDLQSLDCSNNDLKNLNVKNGKNSLIYAFNAQNNPSLTCIKVDNAANASAGLAPYQNWKKDDVATYSEDCVQNTTIADSKFEQLLIDLGIDTDGELNGSITTNNISEITSLDLSGSGITDLTGINAFFNLDTLNISDNELTSLDVSNNTALKYLDCSNNDLASLDLSDNLLLEYIDVSNNPLTPGSLVLPSGYAPGNDAPNPLKAKNSSLANNTLLYLSISNTDLTSIDVSDFESLDTLNVSGSQLDSLDVSANVSLRYLNTTSTPLTCIQVSQSQLDNIPAGWEKDATTSYAVDCRSASGIEDEILSKSLILYPNPVSDILTLESEIYLTKVEIYSIVGGKVKEVYSDFSTIQTGHLARGIYILKIFSENGFASKKFIKE